MNKQKILNAKAFLSVLLIGVTCGSLVTFNACKDDPYFDKAFREVIVGDYNVSGESESISFYDDGTFYMLNENLESIDEWEEVWDGIYNVVETDKDKIVVTYTNPIDDEVICDTMELVGKIGSNNSMKVKNLPMHSSEEVIITRK